MIRNRSTIATLPRTQRGNPLVLGGDPKGKTFLYTNGNSVIIRDIAHPEISDIYTEHSAQTTVAKYSPSGFYICSADITGKVRIWDTTQKEHILKAEYQPFIGTIKDLCWSHDSQRIVVVGEGREKFGHVFTMETGTSLGEIIGHSKQINSCDFRPKRPFKIITGSDDNFIGIYEGPPFKFKNQLSDHQKYVQSVRFSSDGNFFASGGFDGKLVIYKNDNNEKVHEFNEHAGGIYGIAWPTNDSSKIISCSGDKTTKIYDLNAMKVAANFKIGDDLNDQQVSCLWQNDFILSVSLSGYINYLDEREQKIVRTIYGQNKPITAMTVHEQTVITGACDGQIFNYNLTENEGKTTTAKRNHTNQVQALFKGNQFIYSLGFDDKLKFISLNDFDYIEEEVKLDSQPRGGVVTRDDHLVIACYQHLIVVKDFRIVAKEKIAYEATCIAIGSDESEEEIAIGSKERKVFVYSFSGGKLAVKEKVEIIHRDAITSLSYSHDFNHLAVCDKNRRVIVYKRRENFKLISEVDWSGHQASVNCVSWSDDNIHLVTGSVDTSIIVWDITQPMKHVPLRKAHPMSAITNIHWKNNDTIITSGQDSNIKIFQYQQ
ncbi:Actin-interacting protein 1-like protein [Dinothrombium tinctorium]|uniref:Actin-interacting protein 1 n=1 Tax=Dinothrombium tinctorium TaxID=1965070 RepID=A0A3S4R0V7_9ACAR|nr:Actin-interacting protein 1-like protein [Dinothrombium tinctorium]